MKKKWLVGELKPDHVLGLRLRACHERDLIREDRSLSPDGYLTKITAVNKKYSSLIEREIRRTVCFQ